MKLRLLTFIISMAAVAFHTQAGPLSDYDRQIVASCMVLEAGCDQVTGMQAVLNVLLNRAEGYLHRLVPETIKHGAFSCMAEVWHSPSADYSPLIRRAQGQSQAYTKALRLLAIMEHGLLWDNTYGATHYHATYIRPYWTCDMSYITTIGGHHFYIEHSRQYASL